MRNSLVQVQRNCVRLWLSDDSQQSGITRMIVNNKQCDAPLIRSDGPPLSRLPRDTNLSLLVDVMRIIHTYRSLGESIILQHAKIEFFVQMYVAEVFACPSLRLYIRPTHIPYPTLRFGSLKELRAADIMNVGCLFEVPLRVLRVRPVEADKEFDPGEREDSARQILVVRSVFDNGSGTILAELRDVLMETLYFAHAGDLIHVVGRGILVSVGKKGNLSQLVPAIQCVFVRRAQAFENIPLLISESVPAAETSSFVRVHQLADCLLDPTISDCPESATLRTALLLSCAISQSESVNMNANNRPVHMLLVGNTQIAAERLAVTLCNCTVENAVASHSLAQLMESQLALAKRGVCRVNDLRGLMQSHAAASKKFSELLATATTLTTGTMWAMVPQLDAAANASSLSGPLTERELSPSLYALLRFFPLSFRCASYEGSRPINNKNNNIITLNPAAVRNHILEALRALDSGPVTFLPEATFVLEGFIQASRKLRNTTAQEVTINDLGVSMLLARAHAALGGNGSVVHEDDALAAVYLLEESLLCRTGRSLLNFTCELPPGRCNMDMYGADPAMQIEEFGRHVKRFLSAHHRED